MGYSFPFSTLHTRLALLPENRLFPNNIQMLRNNFYRDLRQLRVQRWTWLTPSLTEHCTPQWRGSPAARTSSSSLWYLTAAYWLCWSPLLAAVKPAAADSLPQLLPRAPLLCSWCPGFTTQLLSLSTSHYTMYTVGSMSFKVFIANNLTCLTTLYTN